MEAIIRAHRGAADNVSTHPTTPMKHRTPPPRSLRQRKSEFTVAIIYGWQWTLGQNARGRPRAGGGNICRRRSRTQKMVGRAAPRTAVFIGMIDVVRFLRSEQNWAGVRPF